MVHALSGSAQRAAPSVSAFLKHAHVCQTRVVVIAASTHLNVFSFFLPPPPSETGPAPPGSGLVAPGEL